MRWLIAIACVFLVLAGAATAAWRIRVDRQQAIVVQTFLQQPYETLEGQPIDLRLLIKQQDKSLINFWATWCAPCREEMPLFQQVAGTVGVIGIGYEEASLLSRFMNTIGVRYLVIRSEDIFDFIQKDSGNGALPYTILVDREGAVLNRRLGEFRDLADLQSFIE